MLSVLYTNLSGHTQESIQNVHGVFYILACETVFTTLFRILHTYLAGTPLIRRETNERVYTLSAFYVADCLTDVPFLFIRPLIGLVITYFLAGFQNGFIFFLEIWFILALLSFTSNAYGLMLVGIFREVIMEAPPVFNMFFGTVSGAYGNLAHYPILKFTSVFFYALEAMSILFWHDVSEIGKWSIFIWNNETRNKILLEKKN